MISFSLSQSDHFKKLTLYIIKNYDISLNINFKEHNR